MTAAKAASVRVDKWLWSVRVYRSRTAATDACGAGRVSVNGEPAKPATKIVVGDTVTARRRDRTLTYLVTGLVAKRVSAAAAGSCFEDLSPPAPDRSSLVTPAAGARDRGSGRPTKRDRRRLDRLRGSR
jgi:ribosome-associated heat shock protein Hsp15